MYPECLITCNRLAKKQINDKVRVQPPKETLICSEFPVGYEWPVANQVRKCSVRRKQDSGIYRIFGL